MKRLKIMEHISLDGVVQIGTPGPIGDFPYGDWTAPYRTPAGRDAVAAAHGEKFDLLLGRHTYDLWSGYWPKAPKSPLSDALNSATKYVATHRPESLEWEPCQAVGRDIPEGIRRIKADAGADLIVWGSSTLTSALLEQGLADEVVLLIYPVLLGRGKRFFVEGTSARTLELASSKVLSSGIVMNAYKVMEPLKSQP